MVTNDLIVPGGTVFTPLGQIGRWPSDAAWLDGVSDAPVALAAVSLLLLAIYVVRRREDFSVGKLSLWFAACLVASFATYVCELLTLWTPLSFLSNWIKAAAAAISFLCVLALLRVVTKALRRPGPDALRCVNEQLEVHVRARTADLLSRYERLEREMRQRERTEAEGRRLNDSLQSRLVELQTLLDFLPVGIGIVGEPVARDFRANRALAEMMGHPPHFAVSLSTVPLDALAPLKISSSARLLRPDEIPLLRAAAENKEILDCELTIDRSDGPTLQVLARAVPLRDAAGNARGAVGTFQDITREKFERLERRSFERRMQETQKLESLGVLAGGIAHDFNNLLTGILGNSALARLELSPGQLSVRATLDNLDELALRASDLCRQMLAYTGKGRFVVQRLDLPRLIKETSDLMETAISKRVSLQLDLEEDLPPFSGDATQVRQILMNLVLNASEAIGDRPGVVSLRTGRLRVTREHLLKTAFFEEAVEGPYVYFEVTDNGAGMSAQTLSRIFDPFFTTKFTRRGLGLATVLGIVRGHKGAIDVSSEKGRGTTFKVLFPSLEVNAPPLDAPPAETMEERTLGTFLVIDDESAARMVIAKNLRALGFEVVTARDGLEGTEIFRREFPRFTGVLLDLSMPKMDGEAVLGELREIDPSVRVILMKGFDEPDTFERFIDRGWSGVLSKPFTAEILAAKLTEILGDVVNGKPEAVPRRPM